jgi:2-C-methyl-D-erythritol 4-phosphate cytidylyltransferase
MMSRDVAVIVAAAGVGSRYGTQKQFEMLGDIPIYQHVVRTFAAIEPVHTIILVGREEDVVVFRNGLRELSPPVRWEVVVGGPTRQDSVANGLQAVKTLKDISIVLVHDVARALVDDSLILSVISAVREHGSAVAGIPVVDTLKRVVGGETVETVARENLWRAQTPQGAWLPLLLTAFDAAHASNYNGTDEAELLERIGERPCVVVGSERNFKITYPADLDRARSLVRC